MDDPNSFDNQYLLPREILRQRVSQIRRISDILSTKSAKVSNDSIVDVIQSENPNAEIIDCIHSPGNLSITHGKEMKARNILAGHK
jgi:tetraacyldisaccharide 4'-kinase